MRVHPLASASLLVLTALASAAHAADAPAIVLDGEVPEGDPAYFDLPFEVPAGTVELEVRHDDRSSGNILDWGLADPAGFRGYGGGNSEAVVINAAAASRSYHAGPLQAGTWKVTVGKAKIVERPARYHVEIFFRATPLLAPQPERRAYAPPAPLSTEARWYAGDFHVHSVDSGDARASLDQIALLARERGLDFVLVSDHNTTAQLDSLPAAQERHRDLLYLPGMEWTTYHGHASAIGTTGYVSARLGFEGATLDAAVDAFHAQGGLFSINHPAYDVGEICIGCSWSQPLPTGGVDGVEIATGGWYQSGFLFAEGAIAFWDHLCATGVHAKALGGSDDHRAGRSTDHLSSPIGDPTVMVHATELSVAGILDGIRAGRTVVKMQGPDDPMVDLTALDGEQQGDTVVAPERVHLRAKITGATGLKARYVKNGVAQEPVAVIGDPFVFDQEAPTPATGEDRWRVEVLREARPRTVTSHLWLAQGFGRAGPVKEAPVVLPQATGCSCAESGGLGSAALALLVLCGLWMARRRTAKVRASP